MQEREDTGELRDILSMPRLASNYCATVAGLVPRSHPVVLTEAGRPVSSLQKIPVWAFTLGLVIVDMVRKCIPPTYFLFPVGTIAAVRPVLHKKTTLILLTSTHDCRNIPQHPLRIPLLTLGLDADVLRRRDGCYQRSARPQTLRTHCTAPLSFPF